ncbi:L-sorbosone dehydrogenase [Pseudonocardia sp. Ae168_Ps1]|uniref:PQQ-dependent sugar dehydrogenase n=1 Tax=unclassified Pseudonocardia TaxID=2619320 RepID=UPI00094B4CA5|nr:MULTISPECIES: SMP-30/gluconolactonase/LRE family protein [unclassified Pseudonocardia]OLL71800.1 L-sorbosone dehydrogenase [Pseudonocardia sp. Ae150A_Ps1]OLL77767.1 L-sorbosone dehydrogenase [Pseudonocardia sp. Ae168_Ps1]OLL88109.1 L-sorbosone dehydrogenase [Pseudonocardia sp. Ae263_Ps1]OLL91865.1 L-sorbosone dehydrogenase [Pseudonocardia sp. Ae356_Ps1]
MRITAHDRARRPGPPTRPSRPLRHTRRRLAALACLPVVAVVAACGTGPNPVTNAVSGSEAPVGAAAADLVPAQVAVPDGMATGPFDQPREALVPQGWTMSVFARVPNARLAAWTPDGNLLVSVPDEGRVLLLDPSGGQRPLLEGLTQPHGLAFSPDGATLYVAESDRVASWSYAGGAATGEQVVADGLPDANSPDLRGAYGHELKSVAAGPDGAVYVSIGSTGNISVEDLDATPPRASILRVPPGGGPAEPFAVGVRNGTGLAVAPDGAVWSAVNARDNVPYPYDRPYGDATGSSFGEVIDEYVTAHPAESLAKLTPGRNLGWPYCNPEPDTDPGVQGSAQDFTDVPQVADAEMNPGGRELDCASLAPVEQAFPAHSAPLGLAFTSTALPAPFGGGALAGVHGSWNADPPRAPEVAFFPYAEGRMGPQQTLVGGFQDPSGARWGRPVAAVTGPDGAVYVTDDDAGAVYRVAPPRR